ncbi:CLUMA_CG011282, isoform A [Clunio marinus]|uniref:CLUMA_CG011282, isoform A n=1 Tax=Clunio marinus TaxID=568069 RepID=A0A1J1ICI3_9DIPT|nr:CLUMA_CG011282, isoform A [Clunio marinus]
MKFKSFILPCCFLNYILIIFLIGIVDGPSKAVAHLQPSFELPVQLIGFPVIVLSVRFANFVKKLAYSINPRTYMGRSRRQANNYNDGDISISAINVAQAERQILAEFGPKACILEEPCRIHATRKAKRGAQPDWSDILSHYKVQSNGMKQWYLLSVFIGDEIRDPALCKQLSKRMACNRNIKVPIRD